MITIQQKENIKKLLGEKQSQEKIAKRLGVTRYQVRQIIAQLKQKKEKPLVADATRIAQYRNEIMTWLQ